MTFTGAMTAIITPFRDGRVDEEALRNLIDWQIASGIDAIVPCGTTGESPTVSYEEHDRIVRIAVEQTAGRTPVIAGAGSNATATAIKLAKQAKAAGADGMLQVTPYYNKPTQEGLYQHYRAIAEAVDLPMVLYNVPGRTSVNMQAETTLRLARIDTVVAVKEASGDIAQIRAIIADAPKGFGVLSGDDSLNLEIYRAGGSGAISVTGNVAPAKVAAIWDAHQRGNTAEAIRLQEELSLLNKALFIETNPVPAKTALALMGRCREEFRLPLTPISEGHREELKSVLLKYGLLA